MKSRTRKFPSKRLLKDFKQLCEEGPAEGVYIKPVVEGDLSELRMMIVGPEGPYHMCLFFFHVKFSKPYPLEAPEVKFHCPYSIRCHPNLYQRAPNGSKVCLSILGTWSGPPWSAMMSLMTISQTIKMILDDEPLRNEPGYVNSPMSQIQPYTDYVRYICLRESVERIYGPVRRGDLEAVEPYLRQNVEMFAEEILEVSNANMAVFADLFADNAKKFDDQVVSAGKSYYSNSTLVGKKYNFGELFKLFN